MHTLAEIKAAVPGLTAEERHHPETFLRELRERAEEEHLQELYRRNGVHSLPKRNGAVVTDELVNQIRDEEGI